MSPRESEPSSACSTPAARASARPASTSGVPAAPPVVVVNGKPPRSAAARIRRESRPPVTGMMLGRPGHSARARRPATSVSAAATGSKPAPSSGTHRLVVEKLRALLASAGAQAQDRAAGKPRTAAHSGSPANDQPPPSRPASATGSSSGAPASVASADGALENQRAPCATAPNNG